MEIRHEENRLQNNIFQNINSINNIFILSNQKLMNSNMNFNQMNNTAPLPKQRKIRYFGDFQTNIGSNNFIKQINKDYSEYQKLNNNKDSNILISNNDNNDLNTHDIIFNIYQEKEYNRENENNENIRNDFYYGKIKSRKQYEIKAKLFIQNYRVNNQI